MPELRHCILLYFCDWHKHKEQTVGTEHETFTDFQKHGCGTHAWSAVSECSANMHSQLAFMGCRPSRRKSNRRRKRMQKDAKKPLASVKKRQRNAGTVLVPGTKHVLYSLTVCTSLLSIV